MIYQLKVIRKNSKPPIWRRVLVSSDITFAQLALILNTILERKIDDRYEFESYMRQERVVELGNDSEFKGNAYYSYLEATTTFINEWFADGKNFTLYSRDEGSDTAYRIGIEKNFEKVQVADSGKEDINYPYIIKHVAPADDESWTDFRDINKKMRDQYFYSSCDSPEDLTTSKLKNHIEDGKGIALCSLPPKRNTFIRKSFRKTILEAFDSGTRDMINAKAAASHHVKLMLRDIYEELSTIELSQLSQSCGHELKAKTHGAAVKELAQHMLSLETMKQVLLLFRDETLDEFERIMERGFFTPDEETRDKLIHLCLMGYVAEFTDGVMCIPKDVEFIYESLKKKGYREYHRKARWLLDCLIAFDLLYAVESKQTLYKLYLKNKEMEDDYEDFLSILNELSDFLMPSVAKGERMISNTFLDNGRYVTLDKRRKYGNAYIPDHEKIMEYAIHYYPVSDSAYLRLHNYFRNKMHLPEEKSNELCALIYRFIAAGCSPSDVFGLLEKQGVVFSSEREINNFMPVFIDVNNNTRMFEFTGHTPDEMHYLRKSDSMVSLDKPASQPKIGRNDPCPCGSGKKYKKCCGRYS